jgi:LysM repeat protein
MLSNPKTLQKNRFDASGIIAQMRRTFLFLSIYIVILTLIPTGSVLAQAGTSTPTGEPSAAADTATATATRTEKSPTPSATLKPSATSNVVEVDKAKAGEDGSVIHVVQKGQALWSIATEYGTTVEELIALNNLPAEPVLQIGQKLVVVPPYTATPTPTASNTPRPPTSTATVTLSPLMLLATASPTATATNTAVPLFVGVEALKGLDRRSMGIGLVIICMLGLGGILFFTAKKRKEEAQAEIDPVEALLSEKQEPPR